MARSKVPWGALVYAGVGVAALVRGLRRPKRIVLDGAFALHCAGMDGCDPAVTLQTQSGGQGVYAAAPGRVLAVGPGSVSIMARDEGAVLDYTGLDQVQVTAGDAVGIGQQLGLARQVRFAVYALEQAPDGSLRIGKPFEPASWLATHGQALSAGSTTGHQGLWCEGGRQLDVPQKVAQCGMQLPTPTAWALLPVRVSLA